MLGSENLDASAFERLRHELDAGGLAIAADRFAKTVVDRLGIQERVDKGLAIANGQFKLVMLLDGPPRRVLHAGQHEIREAPALQGGRPLNQILLLSRDPGLEALCPGPATR